MSFQQGLSGLNAAAKNLDVIGNNVANANTVGFKQSQAQFADVYASSLGGSAGTAVGIGTKLATVAQQFSQGTISVTNNPLDIAINGQGFFQMGSAVSTAPEFYSRNGQFQMDKDGYIVSPQGHRLFGITQAGVPGPLQIPTAQIPARATGSSTTPNIGVGVNLDARGAAVAVTADAGTGITVPAGPAGSFRFNPLDPTTYNNSTSTTIYDSLGNPHIATLYFQKAAATVTTNPWNVYLTIDNALVPPPAVTVPASAVPVGGGLQFSTTGNLPTGSLLTMPTAYTPVISGTTTAASPIVTVPATAYLTAGMAVTGTGIPAGTTILSINSATSITLSSAATATGATSLVFGGVPAINPMTLTFDFMASTQYGSNFGVSSLTQDGYTTGMPSGFSTSPDGTILGRYTNGQSATLGQVTLANFANPQGLQPLGNNEWAPTSAAGAALAGPPGTASLGVLQSSAVEDANVDLTAELVNMITAQRVYQANAQTIKAQDAVLQTITNLR